MGIDHRRIAAARDALLQVPFEPSRWEEAMRKLAAAAGSDRAQLVAFGGPGLIPLNCTNDAHPDFADRFVEIDGGSPRVNWRVACAGRPFELTREAHYDEARRHGRYGDYDDLVDYFDLPYGCQTVLAQEEGLLLGLATLRGRSEGRSTPEDCEVFTALAPDVLRAVRTQLALQEHAWQLTLQSMHVTRHPVLLLDGSGRVRGMTAEAEAILRQSSLLRLKSQRLAAREKVADVALQRAIGEALRQPGANRRVWLAQRERAHHGIDCQVFALPVHEHDFGFAPRLLVTLRRPELMGTAQAARLREWFGLTQAEAEVAVACANGFAREDIAVQRRCARATVNDQFKSIFHKVGVVREAELVAVVNRMLR